MIKDVKTKGFVLSTKGDPSTGILPDSWKIEPSTTMYFPSEEDFNLFKKELAQFWADYYSDEKPAVYSMKEWKEIQKQEMKDEQM